MGIKIGANNYKPMFGNSKIKSVWFGNNKVWEGTETWLINAEPSLTNPDEYRVSFVSNGTSYSSIRITVSASWFSYSTLRYEQNGQYETVCRNQHFETEWLDEAYRTIVITPPYDASFKTWLEANAVKQN